MTSRYECAPSTTLGKEQVPGEPIGPIAMQAIPATGTASIYARCKQQICTKLLKVKTTSALDSRTNISPSNVSAPLLPGKLSPSGETGEELPLSFNKAMAEQSGSQGYKKGCFFLGFLPLVPFLFCTSFIDTSMLCLLVRDAVKKVLADFFR